MSLILVTGGSRSGKSEFAEELVSNMSTSIGYIATAQIFDEEMQMRVKMHQDRRGDNWKLFEIPQDIIERLEDIEKCDTLLLDCLTMLISNKLFSYDIDFNNSKNFEVEKIEKEILDCIKNIILKLKESSSTFVVVTNEIGLGVIPDNRLSRIYRDIVGKANQICATNSDEVYLVVSGISIKIKG